MFVMTVRNTKLHTSTSCEVDSDWMRPRMEDAVATAFRWAPGPSTLIVVVSAAGFPASAGKLELSCHSSEEWQDALIKLLLGARIDYETGAGLGSLIEELIRLKADWRLYQR